jgi:hypothetical protein
MRVMTQKDRESKDRPSALALAIEIAKHMPSNWKAKVYSEIKEGMDDYASIAYLQHTDKNDHPLIKVSYDPYYHDPDKITIAYVSVSRWIQPEMSDDGTGQWLQRIRSYEDQQDDTIGMSVKKTREQMANELMRRLMPHAIIEHQKEIEFFAEDHRQRERKLFAIKEFKRQFSEAGFEPVCGNRRWFVRGTRAAVDLHEGGSIEIKGCISDIAKAVLIVQAIEDIMAGRPANVLVVHADAKGRLQLI